MNNDLSKEDVQAVLDKRKSFDALYITQAFTRSRRDFREMVRHSEFQPMPSVLMKCHCVPHELPIWTHQALAITFRCSVPALSPRYGSILSCARCSG